MNESLRDRKDRTKASLSSVWNSLHPRTQAARCLPLCSTRTPCHREFDIFSVSFSGFSQAFSSVVFVTTVSKREWVVMNVNFHFADGGKVVDSAMLRWTQMTTEDQYASTDLLGRYSSTDLWNSAPRTILEKPETRP